MKSTCHMSSSAEMLRNLPASSSRGHLGLQSARGASDEHAAGISTSPARQPDLSTTKDMTRSDSTSWGSTPNSARPSYSSLHWNVPPTAAWTGPCAP